MTEGGFIDPDTWFARLPGVVVMAGALITDPAGQVLLVKPNYRDHWTLPGGICEPGEPPHAGCAREVAEEIGLSLPVGRLLAVDWSQPFGQQARPIMHFVFDGGTLDDGQGIVLQSEELDHFRGQGHRRAGRPGGRRDCLPARPGQLIPRDLAAADSRLDRSRRSRVAGR